MQETQSLRLTCKSSCASSKCLKLCTDATLPQPTSPGFSPGFRGCTLTPCNEGSEAELKPCRTHAAPGFALKPWIGTHAAPGFALTAWIGSCCPRYDRELVRHELPAVRLVLDGAPARSLVLCVAAILPPGPEREPVTPGPLRQAAPGPQLLLTDGWYGVTAALDAPLAGLLQRGRIGLGACCQGDCLAGAAAALPLRCCCLLCLAAALHFLLRQAGPPEVMGYCAIP